MNHRNKIEQSSTPRTVAWHYTTGHHLPAIRASRRILRATLYIPAGVRPVTWLTLSEAYEPTALPARKLSDGTQRRLTVAELEAHAGGATRIGVDADKFPLGWPDYRGRSGETKRDLKRLERTARAWGSDPSLWRVSWFDIYEDEWISVQRLVGGEWIDEPLRLAA